jgi:NAD(P)-dependent dehydrogenase (short-subunit alcohol dehydrogenase family)
MKKEVLITGANSGIGKSICQLFVAEGWTVYLVARDKKKLEATQSELKGSTHIFSCDLSDSEQIQNLCSQLQALKSNISVLVNNAGIYQPSLFENETAKNWETQFATNLFGPVQLTRGIWKQLVQNKGSVVNVSSTLGLRPIERTGAYSASKAALNSWTQTLALEAGPLGVRVNAVCPGLVDTPIHFFHQSEKTEHKALRQQLDKMQPLKRMGSSDDIAKAVYFAATDSFSWMTGALIPVDGGISLTTRDP